MQRGYLKIVYKSALLLLPLLALFVFYIITDPFKVLYRYDSYFISGKAPIVILNKDHVSTETFVQNYPKYQYDSYIFGNSRSMFYEIKDWAPYIHSEKCYHFDAYKESLLGIYLKLKLLQQKQVIMRNALFVVDTNVLEQTEDSYQEANLYMKDPLLTGSNKLFFQYQFVKAFFDGRFCLSYLDYKIQGKVSPFVHKLDVFADVPISYNVVSNEWRATVTEHLIDSVGDAYYNDKKNGFVIDSIKTRYSIPVIYAQQKQLLQKIHAMLMHDSTYYKIVISPHYLQNKINPADLAYLQQLFGKENVFDFSGKNAITEDKHNYYDLGHYRPNAAKRIMSVIYSRQTGL